MLVGAVGASLSMFVIPACGNLSSLIFVLIVMGWCMGCLDCLANLKIIQMFGKNVGPFLQAMHCSYGIGAFVSPMIASAFLLNKDCSPYIDGFTIETPSYQSGASNQSNLEPSTVSLHIPPQPHRVFRYRHMSRLPKAFYILGGLQVKATVKCTDLILHDRCRYFLACSSQTSMAIPVGSLAEKSL
ncbi:major facilitator superfamily domain-containing protein 4 [Plakobranchus ocellatus]|uniref:Major facilitator superfamily domain-containing protein 4 n=1 Tax=Plakobranchus ocellatus TaxID=259542 RepID=A0AAV4DIY2_9GAST|nr:major facilitator superfamily domain-containing protein 4 [Plakobranchus ocellatus]